MFDIGELVALTAPAVGLPSGADRFTDVSGAVLAHLLMSPLADLKSVPDRTDGDALLVDLAAELTRVEAWAVAQRARVLGVLLHRTTAELRRFGAAAHGDGHGSAAAASHAFDDECLAHRMVSTDLALATGITTWAADRELDLAEGLAAHPNLATALAAGRIDRRRVELALAETATLPVLADRVRVITAIVGDGTHRMDDPANRDELIRELRRPQTRLWLLSPATLRRALRRECAAVDAAQAAVREARARNARQVSTRVLPDSMGEFRIEAPAHAVAMMYANVDAAARAARGRGDDRTLDQLRTDISIGWLTEGALGTLIIRPEQRSSTDESLGCAPDRIVGPRRSAVDSAEAAVIQDARCRLQLPRPAGALIVVAMADRTALGLSDDPATLFGPDGPVPIPAAVARQIAHDPSLSTWLGLFTDHRTGIAIDISPHYRPPPRLRTFVKLRDGLRSRLPVSNATRLEIDHLDPYDHDRPSQGGQTTAAGLVSVGVREHHLKTDGALAVAGDANGELSFTTHTGHTYFSWPEPWEEAPRLVDLRTVLARPRQVAELGAPPF